MGDVRMIVAWFDGCCEPVNPGGHASYGALVKVDGEVVLAESGYIGHGAAMSNNVAEYSGFLAVLRQLGELPGPAEIRGDSKLVILQMLGQWRIHEGRGGLYVPYALKAQSLLAPLQSRVQLVWIPREENGEADELSKRALRERGVEFRLQREGRRVEDSTIAGGGSPK